MDNIIILFLIGMAVGIILPIVEQGYNASQLLEEPLTAIEHVFTAAAQFWRITISVLLLISLPAIIFKSMRNRLSKKKFLPIPFMTGMSFGFTFMGLLGMVTT